MSLSFEEADYIYRAPKRLIPPLIWKDVPNRHHKNPKHKLECRVAIDDSIQRGLFFRILFDPNYANSLTFQFEVDQREVRSHVVLHRLDVFPRAAHTNPLDDWHPLCGDYIPIQVTHEHVFYDNLHEARDKIRKSSDAYARPIIDPPLDFSSCVNHICSTLNIENGIELPQPESQTQLNLAQPESQRR